MAALHEVLDNVEVPERGDLTPAIRNNHVFGADTTNSPSESVGGAFAHGFGRGTVHPLNTCAEENGSTRLRGYVALSCRACRRWLPSTYANVFRHWVGLVMIRS